MPPSNAYPRPADLARPEVQYPLRLHVCNRCWLVQTEDYAQADELFAPDYAYFSSMSSSWLTHAREYCAMIRDRVRLDSHSLVIEVASNDGYLLRNFVASGIPCLGIEPTADTATAAEALGIPVVREFFGIALARRLAMEGQQADLIVGNNVYAHVPDINDFTQGLSTALKPGGTITLEFSHLLQMIQHTQFDTVYHEHFSYLSLYTVNRMFAAAGLRVFDVDELSTHGGSLRIYGCHDADERTTSPSVTRVLQLEEEGGLRDPETYSAFSGRVGRIADQLRRFLKSVKEDGKRVVGYGAAAKGNTLLNFAGIGPDLLPVVYDAAPSKQGRLMPGSRIPIWAPEQLDFDIADYILLLPWNIAPELQAQLSHHKERGAKFVTAVPTLEIH